MSILYSSSFMKLSKTRSSRKQTTSIIPSREIVPTVQPEKTKKVKVKRQTMSTADELSVRTQSIESILMTDPFIASSWTQPFPFPSPPPIPASDVSSINPLKLNYNIEIFQGALYPYPEYVSFLYQRALNLISVGEISGRTCVNVARHLIETGTEPRYAELVPEVLAQKLGDEAPGEIPITQRIKIAQFKTSTAQSVPFVVKDFKNVDECSEVSECYFKKNLSDPNRFRSQLTVMITTTDPTSSRPLIASIIILSNGSTANRYTNNGTQYIDTIANNPDIARYPFLKSTAVSVLFTLIRETTVLAAYLPNEATFTGLLPATADIQEKGLLYKLIYGYLKYCAVHGKPSTIAEVPVICDFKRITLSAINWNVAFIYRNLGFVPTKIKEGGYIDMELPIKSVANVLLINRVGFLFSVLQEIPLSVLTTETIMDHASNIGTIIASKYATREQIMSIIGVPGRVTASIESIKIGGRQRPRHVRRSRKRKTLRRQRK